MTMQININRKPNNTRVGSRAWAASLPADEWTWKITRYNAAGCYDSDRIDIHNGDNHIASLEADIIGCTILGDLDYILEDSIRYGGIVIGHALLSDLCEWAQELDINDDDAGKVTLIASGRGGDHPEEFVAEQAAQG